VHVRDGLGRVKAAWELMATPAEWDALMEMLAGC
jgi:hypothetical protein